MAAPGPLDEVSCPYDPSHIVSHYKLHLHLVKCNKQHQNSKTVKCPYDTTHVINEMERHHHSSVCCKRDMLDNMMYVTDEDHRPVVPVQQPPPIQSEENWDEDEPSSYVPDPWKNPHIIKKVKGATKSERRKARMEGVKSYRPPPEMLE